MDLLGTVQSREKGIVQGNSSRSRKHDSLDGESGLEKNYVSFIKRRQEWCKETFTQVSGPLWEENE